MAVSQARLGRYRSDVDAYAGAARSYVEQYLRALMEEFPGMSVAELRDEAIGAVDDSLNAFGDQAAALSLELLEEVVSERGIEPVTEVEGVVPREMVEGAVRYRARALVEGESERFVRDVADLSRYYVHRCALENMERNCERNDLRYARVPSGRETCGFCFMLSSRGFVYRSEETAGSMHAYHDHCDCVIVPGFKDSGRELGPQIEGYDPKGMRERWHDCQATVGTDKELRERWKSMTDRQRARYKGDTDGERYRRFANAQAIGEAETRDFQWLNSKEIPHYEVEPGAMPKRKEIDTAQRLANHGYKSRFRKTRSNEGKRTSDVFFLSGDSANPVLTQWEFKGPTGNGRQTISHQFEDAAGQSKNLVMDATGLGDYWTRERLEKEVQQKLNREHTIQKGPNKGEKWLFDEALIVMRDGSAIKKWRD